MLILLAGSVTAAFRTAAEAMPLSFGTDTDPADEQTDEDALAGRINAVKENLPRLRRAEWFWTALTGAFGTGLLSYGLRLNVWICASVSLALVYVFGICVPYLIARRYPAQTVRRLYSAGRFCVGCSVPFTAVLSFTGGLIARIIGVDPKHLEDAVTEDEILSMVNEGSEQGNIDEDEAEMIQNIFELDDKDAQDIMTHRSQILAIDGGMSLDGALSFMLKAPNSRFPVYNENIDNIIGALYLKDAMRFHMMEGIGGRRVRDIQGLLREVKFVPETVGIDDLFHDMQASQKQMAIVVDEYGETSGLVTMEDILEEIVGNILDEYDKDEKFITKIGRDRWRLNGMALTDEVEDALDIHIPGDFETLNGYLTAKLRHIPNQKDRGTLIEDKNLGIRFRILSLKGNIIQWAEARSAPDLRQASHDVKATV